MSRCYVLALSYRLVHCVLSSMEAAEEAVTVKKVDPHDPPPTDDVPVVEDPHQCCNVINPTLSHRMVADLGVICVLPLI